MCVCVSVWWEGNIHRFTVGFEELASVVKL